MGKSAPEAKTDEGAPGPRESAGPSPKTRAWPHTGPPRNGDEATEGSAESRSPSPCQQIAGSSITHSQTPLSLTLPTES